MSISNNEYWTEVKSIAKNLVSEALAENDNNREEAEEAINDHNMLHETIDSHQWVINNSYNLDVIQHSDGANYYVDNFGGEALEESPKGGLDTLHCYIAFWALYADVQEAIDFDAVGRD